MFIQNWDLTIRELLKGLKISSRSTPFTIVFQSRGGFFHRRSRNFSRSAFMDPSVRKLQRHPIMGQGRGRTPSLRSSFERDSFFLWRECEIETRRCNQLMSRNARPPSIGGSFWERILCQPRSTLSFRKNREIF